LTKRVLSVDFGKKNVGLAIGNTITKLASPLLSIENKSFDYLSSEILKIIDEWGIDILLFGLPLNMEKKHLSNPITKDLFDFIDFFKARNPKIVIELFDERLSTFEAKKILEDSKVGYHELMKKKDSVSAQIILDRWLNKDE